MPIRVLVVDDSTFFCQQLIHILNSDPALKVIGVAQNGREAIQKIEQLKPDVVTMDITMPGADGISTLREIKRHRPDARIVMISALGQKEKIMACIRAGAMDFILKPFIPDKVIGILDRIASR